MHIEKLYIRNFRNFSEVAVPFATPVTAIIGPNNVGKSNLLAALQLLFDPALSRQARLLEKEDFHEKASVDEGREILISAILYGFENSEVDQAYCSKWKVSSDRAVVTYRFRPTNEARLNAAERQAQIEEAKRSADPFQLPEDIPKPWVFGLDSYDYDRVGGFSLDAGGMADVHTVKPFEDFGIDADRALNSFVFVELPAVRDVVRDMASRRSSPLHKLLDLIEVPSDVREHVEGAVRTANDDICKDDFFMDLQGRLETSFTSLAAVPDPIKLRVGLSDPSFSVAIRSLALLLTDSALNEAEMSRNSLGYNNLLYVALLMEYLRQRSPEKANNQVLAIEEPEAHLHPNAQVALIRTLRLLKHQTILTTHSGSVASAVGIEHILALSSRDGKTSVCQLADAISASSSEIADLNRYLDLNRSRLLLAREVVLVEGISEELLILALAEQRGLNLPQRNVAVIAVVGNHFALLSRLFGSTALRVKCHIVTDGDLQNKRVWLRAREPDRGDRHGAETEGDALMYACATTLEMALTQPKNREWIRLALVDIGAVQIADAVYSDLASSDPAVLQRAQLAVVRTARRLGKGRFAQSLVRHLNEVVVLPQYIADLLDEVAK
jgi:putative ATP-dependent endonuclease of OLD family